MSLFRKVPVSLTSLRLCWPSSEENFTRHQSYTSGTAEDVLECRGLSRPALRILKVGGSGGMLPRENFKIWVPEWLKIQCGPCTCSHVTATRIKGLPTGTFLRAQSEFRCRNGWKYRIRCRFISFKFRCRKFPAARCHLSPFRSPRVAVSRPCRLSEFTSYRAWEVTPFKSIWSTPQHFLLELKLTDCALSDKNTNDSKSCSYNIWG